MAQIEKPEDTNEPVVALSNFKGLRNLVSPEFFDSGDLVEAVNVDVDNANRLHRRKGYTSTVPLAGTHSLWSDGKQAFFVKDDGFYQLNEDYSYAQLGRGLTPNLPMCYIEVHGTVFHSNGVELAAVDHGALRAWGVISPTAPLAAQVSGQLPAGTYQYAVTFMRSDGFESGASHAYTVELAAGSGIHFSVMPVSTNPQVVATNIYLTQQNGDMLYFAATVPVGTSTYDYLSNGLDLKRPLRTQFKDRPIAATQLHLYHGRIYAVKGAYVYYTPPYEYELMDLRSFMSYNSSVRVFAPVKDGIFVATDTETLFLRGDDVGSFVVEHLTDYGAVEGTLAYDSITTENGVERMAYWESNKGKVKGLPNGILFNLTEDRYVYAPGSKGASIVVEQDGIRRFISVMQP